jgi:REP element-mobilizing transposase RayT
MAQDLSYENPNLCFFGTTRTQNSRLWFINNPKLEQRILAYLARYQELYGVTIYAFVIMGNHYHLLAKFPRSNKAAFFQAFNAIIAKLTNHYVDAFEGGRLWARRVRVQAVPRNEDIENEFFYSALNPVSSGLTRLVSSYRSYSSFTDAVYDRRKTFTVINWAEYNNRKRFNPNIKPQDYASKHTLTYSRLPGYEDMTKAEYIKVMHKKLEENRTRAIEKRLSEGKGFANVESLAKQTAGARPRATKNSKRDTHRPLVLTLCMKTKEQFLSWYFSMLEAYRLASRHFRAGDSNHEFPRGTYQPTRFSPSLV